MNPRIRALMDERDGLLTKATEIQARYPGVEKMSGEDSNSFDAIMSDYDDKCDAIKQVERLEVAQKAHTVPATAVAHPGVAVDKADDAKAIAKRAWAAYLRNGEKTAQEHMAVLRAYQADSDTEGGYLVAPQEMVMQLLANVTDAVFVRQKARIFQLPRAESLGVPTLDTRMNDADWTSELATGTEDTALRFGMRALTPHPLAKQAKLSNTLVRKSAIDPETLVREEFTRKFAETEEKAFLTGTGAQQPLGIFTVGTAAGGITTARDKATGSTTDVTADGLIDAAYFLKPQYWKNASWMLHRDVLRNIRKLKDGTGNYIWSSGIANKTEPTILDFPYTVSEWCPNTFTTGLYLAVLADYSYYWIAEALDMRIQVLNELYALTNQIGFVARAELDGMPVLEEAFVRVKTS